MYHARSALCYLQENSCRVGSCYQLFLHFASTTVLNVRIPKGGGFVWIMIIYLHEKNSVMCCARWLVCRVVCLPLWYKYSHLKRSKNLIYHAFACCKSGADITAHCEGLQARVHTVALRPALCGFRTLIVLFYSSIRHLIKPYLFVMSHSAIMWIKACCSRWSAHVPGYSLLVFSKENWVVI